MNGNTYANDIVNGILPNFQAAIGPHFIYIDDSTRLHRTRNVIIALENNGMQHLALPPRSPDLNPIEHEWNTLGNALQNYLPPPENTRDLSNILPLLWQEISQDHIDRLIRSMRRVREVIRRRGRNTRY
jgi:transposase